MRDHRDLVIEDLAADLHRVERERDSFRELLSLTLNQLHDALARQHTRHLFRLPLIVDENRRAA